MLPARAMDKALHDTGFPFCPTCAGTTEHEVRCPAEGMLPRTIWGWATAHVEAVQREREHGPGGSVARTPP